jgi:hypothetical protein
MQGAGGHKTDAGVVMLPVIPVEETLTKQPSVLYGSKTIREIRSVFEGLNLSLPPKSQKTSIYAA